METLKDFALQQFTGFICAKNGYNIVELAIEMGLSKEEFTKLEKELKIILSEEDFNMLKKHFK